MRMRRVSRWGKPPTCPCAGECKHTRSTRGEEAPSVRLTVRWHRLVEKWKDNKWEMAPRCQAPFLLCPLTCLDCCWGWATYVNVFRQREAITAWGTTIITRRSHVAASANASCYNEKKATTTTATGQVAVSLSSDECQVEISSRQLKDFQHRQSFFFCCCLRPRCGLCWATGCQGSASGHPIPIPQCLFRCLCLCQS